MNLTSIIYFTGDFIMKTIFNKYNRILVLACLLLALCCINSVRACYQDIDISSIDNAACEDYQGCSGKCVKTYTYNGCIDPPDQCDCGTKCEVTGTYNAVEKTEYRCTDPGANCKVCTNPTPKYKSTDSCGCA